MAKRITSADVIAINSSTDMIKIINQISEQIPELGFLVASPVKDISFKTLVMTALPSAGFRAVNAGLDHTEAVFEAKQVDCQYLDASWTIDNAALKGIRNTAFVPALQRAHLLAAMKKWQRQIYDGVVSDAAGFPGYASLFPYKDSEGVVDAGGTSAGTGSSIYLVKTGEADVSVPWGMDGSITQSDVIDCLLYDDAGKSYHGKAQEVAGYAGLQLTNRTSLLRVANVTEDVSHGCTDSLLSKATVLFRKRYGVMPDGIFMSYRSWQQLHDSRVATSDSGKEADLPEGYQKVEIFPTLGITDTETLLGATPQG